MKFVTSADAQMHSRPVARGKVRDIPCGKNEVFVDLEGTDPRIGADGLEVVNYLIGAVIRRPSGEAAYKAFFATAFEHEEHVLKEFFDWASALEEPRFYHWHHPHPALAISTHVRYSGNVGLSLRQLLLGTVGCPVPVPKCTTGPYLNGTEWDDMEHFFTALPSCNCSAIMSSLTVKRKCPHEGACDIDAERADKASGSQQFDGGPYDHGAGSDFDGSERAPHQAYSGGLQKGRRSRTRSRQSRSQTGQRYIGPVGDRRGGPGEDPIRGSQPHAPE